MKQTRSLNLKREALTELSTDDLTGIAGARQLASQIADTCTIGNSVIACSLRCQWTFNTCDC
jgi:hypothetical protein